MRPYVVYVQDAPFPYWVERFNTVAERGNIELEAWFWAHRTFYSQAWPIKEEAWSFAHRYIPAIPWRFGKSIPLPTPLLIPGRRTPDLLVNFYLGLSTMPPWLVAHWRGIRTVPSADVMLKFGQSGLVRPTKEWFAGYMFSRADGIFTGGPDGRAAARAHGTPDERIFHVPHAIDVDHFVRGRARAIGDRDAIRDQLGLRGVTFIYVGRLEKSKGLPYLFEAFATLQSRLERRGQETSLLLVGEGSEEAGLRARCQAEAVSNVVFAGFQQRDEVPRFYAAADVFVFPSLLDPYGMVVDEAMASSLPVISSEVGEIAQRVAEGRSGYIVPRGNSAALLDRMECLALNPELRTAMGKEGTLRIAGNTPERWAKDVEGAVEQILARTTSASVRSHLK